MSNIVNSDTLKEIRETTGNNYIESKFPSVIPVIDVNPKKTKILNIFYNKEATTTGQNINIYTTPIDRDFFLTNCSINKCCDATSDAVTGSYLTIPTADGKVMYLVLAQAPLVAGDNTLALTFQQHPIRIKRGGVIVLTNATFSAGKYYSSGSIQGYEILNNQVNYA